MEFSRTPCPEDYNLAETKNTITLCSWSPDFQLFAETAKAISQRTGKAIDHTVCDTHRREVNQVIGERNRRLFLD